MKIQMLMKIDNDEPDEIVGLAPFRDKIIIATRSRLLMLEHDEETKVKIKELIRRLHNDLWPDI